MNKILPILFACIICNLYKAQLFINEASNANGTNYVLANGTSPDWIEIYNSSATPQAMQGLYLSDNRTTLNKWAFHPIAIPANGFATILANQQGTTYLVNHFEILRLSI